MAPSEDSKHAAGKRPRTLFLLALVLAALTGVVFIGFEISRDRQAEQADSAEAAAAARNPSRTASDDSHLSPREDLSRNADRSGRQTPGVGGSDRASTRASPEDEQLDLSISGAVYDDAGQLLAQATVTAQAVTSPDQGPATAQSSAAQLTQVTDQLGSFEFQNLEDGEYQLTASKGDEYFPASKKVRAGINNAELTLQRFRTVRVFGQISDEAGAPLGEVKVRSLGTRFDVTSDQSGAYEILTAPVRAGLAPVLDFQREGFQEARRRVEAALDPDTEEVQLDVRLEPDPSRPKVSLSGQVVGPNGEPVAGETVRLKSFELREDYAATTDESGQYEFPEVSVGDGYGLRVMPSEDYEAYESEPFSLGPGDAYHDIELEAAGFADLSGTVTDLEGRPLGSFALWLRGVGSSAQPLVPVQTDGAGRFELEALRAGEVRLESRSQPLLRASNIVLEPGKHSHVQVPLDWGNDWLLGRVVDSDGQPVTGARVVVSWEDRFQSIASESRREARTDLEGYFTVSNLGAENYTLTVQAPGRGSMQMEHRLGDNAEELLISLPMSGSPGGGRGGG